MAGHIDRALAKELLYEATQGREDYDLNEFQNGLNVEREHTGTFRNFMRPEMDELNMLSLVVLDHLREDPHYYTKLKKAGL